MNNHHVCHISNEDNNKDANNDDDNDVDVDDDAYVLCLFVFLLLNVPYNAFVFPFQWN